MLPWLMGFLGFALYFLYDIDSFTGLWKPLRFGFAAGSGLIAGSTLLQLVRAFRQAALSQPWDKLLLVAGLAAFAALIYCLFFALPFSDTYTAPEQGRQVCRSGVYALCRHPGILCFFVMYLFWGLAALPTRLLLQGMVWSLLNLAYAWFQDRVTFPKTFSDYPDYRQEVPFLIPTPASIRRAKETWGEPFKKEEIL